MVSNPFFYAYAYGSDLVPLRPDARYALNAPCGYPIWPQGKDYGVLEPPEVFMDVLVRGKVEYRVADELPGAVERYVPAAAYDLEVNAPFGQQLIRNEQVGHVAPAPGCERGGVFQE